MFFKNLTVFRLLAPIAIAPPAGAPPSGIQLDGTGLRHVLSNRPLPALAPFERRAVGWLPEVELAGNSFLLSLFIEEKILPAATVKRRVAELSATIAEEQGFPVGRRHLRELKEKVLNELLPKALTKRQTVRGLLSDSWLIVDTSSQGRADEFVHQLREALGELKVEPFLPKFSLAAAAGTWLPTADAPGKFSPEDTLDLKALDKTGATVKYRRGELPTREIMSHLQTKQVVALGLSWADKIAFVLNDKLQLRKVEFIGVKAEQPEEANADDARAAELAIMAGEFNALLGELAQALGGFDA